MAVPDLAAALAALTAARAELHGVPATALGSGLDHAAFRVGDLVLRLGAESEREARLLAVVGRRCPVAVPAPVAVGPGWMAYPIVPGTPLLDRPAAARDRVACTVAATVGCVLGRLHATPRAEVDGIVADDDTPLAEWRDEAGALASALRSELPDALRPRIDRWLCSPLPAAAAERALSHNDLGAEHVLVDGQGRVTGIIDWSDAAIVDRAKDLGLVLRDLGPAAFDVARRAAGATDRGLPDRARLYARCLALEDLAFGLRGDRPRYAAAARDALARLFPAAGT